MLNVTRTVMISNLLNDARQRERERERERERDGWMDEWMDQWIDSSDRVRKPSYSVSTGQSARVVC